MTFPIPNYSRVWVRGRFVDMAKAAALDANYGTTAPVTFTPSPRVLLDAGTKQIISTGAFTATPSAVDGYFAVNLPATDDPDINPTGWTYAVVEPTGRTYNIIVPINTPILNSPGDPLTGQRVIELISVVPAPAPSAGSVQLIMGADGRGIADMAVISGDVIVTYTDSATDNLGPLPSASPELIRDTMGAALVAGSGVTITPNDGADTITIAASGGDQAFDVKDFGAVGNGTTDDRAAIQAAITAAAPVKGVVYFPPGTYRVTLLPASTPLRALTLAPGITFRGAGTKASTLKLASSVGEYVTIFGHATAADVGGVGFEDLTIDQNNTNNQITGLTALLSGSARYAIYVTNATAPVNVHRCNFVDLDNVNTISVSGAVHNLTVKDSVFTLGNSPINHDHSTIYHHPFVSRAVWIVDNVFTSPGSGSNSAITAIETHGSMQVVRGNEVRNFHIGANLTGVGSTTGEGAVCEGNSFLDVRYGLHLWSMPYTGGLTVNPTLRSVVVRDNTIRIDTDGWDATFTSGQSVAGIRLGGATGSIEDVTLENNLIIFSNGSHVGSSTTDSNANGIDWYRAALDPTIVDRRIKIRHNTIVNALAAGIRVSSYGEAFDVSENTILNPGRGSVAAGGSVLNAYAVGVSITGVLTHSRVNRNTILDTQGTHTLDIALWLFPLATGSANNECLDNLCSGWVTKLLQTHTTNGGWKFRATTPTSFASPGGLLAADSTITERATGTTYRQTATPEGSTWLAKPTVTGSRGGNAALASLTTALASLGVITDSTTA